MLNNVVLLTVFRSFGSSKLATRMTEKGLSSVLMQKREQTVHSRKFWAKFWSERVSVCHSEGQSSIQIPFSEVSAEFGSERVSVCDYEHSEWSIGMFCLSLSLRMAFGNIFMSVSKTDMSVLKTNMSVYAQFFIFLSWNLVIQSIMSVNPVFHARKKCPRHQQCVRNVRHKCPFHKCPFHKCN